MNNTLPKTGKELWDAFKNARVPSPAEFEGEYEVDMLTVLPSLRRFAHRKTFEKTGGAVTGRNVLFRSSCWGGFFLEESVIPGPEGLKAVVINYNIRGNTFLTRRIRDYVRSVDGTRVYLGRFTLMVNNKPRFLGYFSLTKIDAS